METGLNAGKDPDAADNARMPDGTGENGGAADRARQYSPLVLAYLGDAVYELMIRTRVVSGGNAPVKSLHKTSSGLVKAETQARLIAAIEPELTETERAVYKRGRNAKAASVAKHATVRDYRVATGFEALAGYLYLSGQYERLTELVDLGIGRLDGADGGQTGEETNEA